VLNRQDSRWLAAAATLSERGRPASRPNPAVGAIIVRDDVVVARGWTQDGGRPHAEAVALKRAGDAAKGATLYVSLEPCAHRSERGPACSDLVGRSGLSRVVIGQPDPDSRTSGRGVQSLQDAGLEVEVADDPSCAAALEGYLARRRLGRPHVTVKLALSIDGCIALASGESQWITGPACRAHAHRLRARCDAILVGGGTLRKDDPALTVRLPGLEDRSPERVVLTHGSAPASWRAIGEPAQIAALEGERLLVEGGAGAAAAIIEADLADRLVVYRAPIVIGGGLPGVGDVGLGDLSAAHGRWRLTDRRVLGSDTLEIYDRAR
jgi:diaminohydroxyphosphoribosylaminopyrimidine deaminase/5-amino-6-(5-phosphoribosylamino)uracil reductase